MAKLSESADISVDATQIVCSVGYETGWFESGCFYASF